jgi:hypothetical protein
MDGAEDFGFSSEMIFFTNYGTLLVHIEEVPPSPVVGPK